MKRLAILLALFPALASADGIAYRVGKGVQIVPTATAPTKASGSGLLWIDSGSSALKYKNAAGVTVSLSGGAGTYNQTIEDEGVALTQRTNLNFTGAGISCADSGGKTVCTVSGGGSTGNWTFTGDAADDSGAAVLTIGATTATGVTIGRTAGANILAADTTLASGKTLTGAAASDLYLNAVTGQDVRLRVNGTNVLSAGGSAVAINQSVSLAPNMGISISGAGTSAIDFSNGTGIFKTSTGAASYLGSSNVFTADIDPLTDSAEDIGDGAATKFWRVAYVNDISFKGSTGPFTIGAYGGTNYLSILSASCSTGASSCSRIVGSQGSHTTLEVAPDTATTLTASTEHIDVLLDMNRAGNDVQFSTGALATQRSVLVKRPRYAFVGASTITNAATLAIDAAPEASTNATITNSYALWVQAGRIAADGGLKLTGDLTGVYNIAGTPTATSPILANLGATTVAPTWTAITYSNSWVDYGASSTSRYSKNATGQVTLEIRCKNGSTATAAINSGTPIAAGYRPSQVTQICGQTLAGGIACGDLDTGGVFTPSVSSTSGIFLRAQYFAEN